MLPVGHVPFSCHVPAFGRRDTIHSAMAIEKRAAAVEHTVMKTKDSQPGLSVFRCASSFAMSPPIVPIETKRSPTPMKDHKFQAASRPSFTALRWLSVTDGLIKRRQSAKATRARAKSGPYMGEARRSMAINANTPPGRRGPTRPRNRKITGAEVGPFGLESMLTVRSRSVAENCLPARSVLHQWSPKTSGYTYRSKS